MNEIQIFKNQAFGEIRTVTIDNEPWFVGKDVAEVLGYQRARNAIASHVDAEDKKDALIQGPLGGKQQMTVINESGLYSLVLSSKLPTAREFKRWITSEVLPTIRKTGGYVANDDLFIQTYLPNADEATTMMLRSTLATMRALNAKIEADKPKVLFADSVSASKTSILVGELAKLIRQNGVGIGQNRLFEWMRENGYLVRRTGRDYNMPTQKAMELGLFEIKETVVSHADGHTDIKKTPKVTGKGQIYFVNKFCS